MKVLGVIFAATASLLAGSANATSTGPLGKGFDCRFQTGFEKFSKLSIWYGPNRRGGASVPQVQDVERLFALRGLNVGQAFTIGQLDEWPERFTLNYFVDAQRRKPISMLTIFSFTNEDGVFIADSVQFSPENDSSDGTKLVPLKRYRGYCHLNPEVAFLEFRNGLAQ
jgi:hypothetical protein